MIAYISAAIFNLTVLLADDKFFHKTNLIESTLVFLWIPIPIFYVLVIHLRSFKKSAAHILDETLTITKAGDETEVIVA